jgi:hypothetical protein
MHGVWFDWRRSERLRDEVPSAYRGIRAVLRAQRDLVKIVCVLRPVPSYKGAQGGQRTRCRAPACGDGQAELRPRARERRAAYR